MVARNPPSFVEKSGSSVAYTSLGADASGCCELFVRLSVRALRDQRLSLAARGLLAELSTYHDGEMPSAEDLEQANKAARRELAEKTGTKAGYGQSHASAMKELEQLGYLFRQRIYAEKGRPVSIRALTDTPGHHKFDLPGMYEAAMQLSDPGERKAAVRDLAEQRDFPRPVHAYRPADHTAEVISLADRRARKTA
jgi:hypothetical protein